MPKPQKRKPGPKATSFTTPQAQSPSTATTTHIFTKPPPPPPFTLASKKLSPFLFSLPRDHIYIISLDPHPRDFKRRLFAVPVLLNIFLSVVLIYRLRYALPTYLSLFLTTLGFETEHQVTVQLSETGYLFSVLGERMMMMMGDFILFRFIGGWPWGFFLGWLGGTAGLGSPVAWRWRVGWRDVEIVVRRSRRWDQSIFGKVSQDLVRDGVGPRSVDEWLGRGKVDKVFQERIEPAVAKSWIRDKTGYLMMDKNWDLSFAGMIAAHGFVDDGVVPLDDFRTRVLVYSEQYGGWLVWDVWKEHEDGMEKSETGDKLHTVRERLTKTGKENLFYRWIEVLQSETSLEPGPLTKERREKALNKIREEFDEEDVDFDDFWDSVGGVDDMPGLEVER